MIQNSQYDLLDTHKSGVKFRSSRMTELNDDYTDIYKQYTEHQQSIVSEVIGVAS